MTANVTVDLTVCQGMASCAMEAPDIFGIDEEDGKSVVLDPEPPDAQRAAAAARLCPTAAITVRHG